MARRRLAQHLLQVLRRPEDLPLFHRDDAVVLAVLVHRRVDQSLRQPPLGHDPGPARLASRRGGHRLAERRPRSPSRTPGTRRWSSTPAARRPAAAFDLGDDRLGVLDPSAPRGSPPGPACARGRRRRDPSSRRSGRRRGSSGRSSSASCRRTPTSHRTGPRGSRGEKATSSSWVSLAC